jgi:ribosomal protein L17
MRDLDLQPQIVFLLQEVNILSLKEIQESLISVFSKWASAEELILAVKHLQDKNLISIIFNNKYHIRKAGYTEIETAQLRNLVSSDKMVQKNFKKWKDKFTGKVHT